MLQNRKVTPNLDQQSTKALNLIVLQRGDPFVEEILMTATHVTLYEFSIDLNQWVLPSAPPIPSPSFLDWGFFFVSFYLSRKDVEGSLFVVKRNTQPRFQFIVMNRRNAGIRLVLFGESMLLLTFISTCERWKFLCSFVTVSFDMREVGMEEESFVLALVGYILITISMSAR
ncbi:unnamed protein product [Musa textilis]